MRRVESVLPTRLALPRIAMPALPATAFSAAGMRDGLRHVSGSGWHWSKLLSALLLVVAVAGIYWVHWDTRWFISAETIAFSNAGYLERDDLYPSVEDLADWSIFWVRPEAIQELILDHPYVTDAEVSIALPNRVEIEIEEAEPTALWVTQEGTLWLLEDGAALAMRVRPGLAPESAMVDATGRELPQIIDVTRDAQAPGRSAIDADVLDSALALLETFPESTGDSLQQRRRPEFRPPRRRDLRLLGRRPQHPDQAGESGSRAGTVAQRRRQRKHHRRTVH